MSRYLIKTKSGATHYTANLSSADESSLTHAFYSALDVPYTDSILKLPLTTGRAGNAHGEILSIRAHSIESITEVY